MVVLVAGVVDGFLVGDVVDDFVEALAVEFGGVVAFGFAECLVFVGWSGAVVAVASDGSGVGDDFGGFGGVDCAFGCAFFDGGDEVLEFESVVVEQA